MFPVDTAEGYAAGLTAKGIRATADPTRAVPPCVLFEPPRRAVLDVMCGSGTAQMSAVLLARGGPGNNSEWHQLDVFLGQVLAAGVVPVEDVELVELDVDGVPASPGYRISWTETVSWI